MIPCRAAVTALAALAAAASPSPAVRAAEPPPRAADTAAAIGFVYENDIFANADRHYTSGVQAFYSPPESSTPDWITDAAEAFPLLDPAGHKRVVFSLGQKMYTPADISRPVPDPDDQPYAGFLYADVGVLSETARRLDRLNLTLGVVGPWAFARQTQIFVHHQTRSTIPKGWSHQLRNEPAVVLSYERAWRGLYEASPFGLGFDVTPRLGGSIGNVATLAAAGVTVRLGVDLPQDYGPPRISPANQGTSAFVPGRDFGWYLFAGAEGRAVARNIFLDGNSFRDGPSVDRRPWVGDLQAGLAVTVGGVRLAYTHIFRTKQFDGQPRADQFGSLSLSARF